MTHLWSLFFLIAPPSEGSPNPIVQFLPFIAIFFIFYFLLLRPQQKRQREVQKMREELKKGDRILTSGGIYGQVVGMGKRSVILKVDDKTKIQVDKSAIAGKQEAESIK